MKNFIWLIIPLLLFGCDRKLKEKNVQQMDDRELCVEFHINENEQSRTIIKEEINRREKTEGTYIIRPRFWDEIKEERVMTNMKPCEVVASWGLPDDVNQTKSTYGTRQQWVWDNYEGIPSAYIYFENGNVTSIQN